MDRDRLARLAKRQLGVFTREQAVQCGYSGLGWVGLSHDAGGVPARPAATEPVGRGGLDLLRFTWRDVTERPDYVVQAVRNTLRLIAAGRRRA